MATSQNPQNPQNGRPRPPLTPEQRARRMARIRARRKRQQRARLLLALCVLVVLALIIFAVSRLLKKDAPADADKNDVPVSTPAASQPEGGDPDDSEPAIDAAAVAAAEAAQRIQEVMATMQDNCTKDAAHPTDPATWNEAGKALMDRLEADPYYHQYGFTASVEEISAAHTARRQSISAWQEADFVDTPDVYPYFIAVNRAASTVTVYTADEEGRYTVPYMAMVCSGGDDTPLGFYYSPISYNWRLLSGPCYGQYATRIFKGYLFHSVPYYTQYKDDVEYDQFNQLGTLASLGCIRLMVVDVKWIYDNCPIGTPVVIYDDANDPGPMGKPGTIYTDPKDESMRGWDPTDPDERNPWPEQYRTGTTIRSQAAWDEFNAAMADGRWKNSINGGKLRGFSTDSSVEGTRG